MTKSGYLIILFSTISLLISSCENRDVNSNDGPNFSEIHEEISYHFDSVAIDGSEYFILERDRNNPHEGFGFMALKGTDIKLNQDTIKAYLKTMIDLQTQINAKLNNLSEIEATEYTNDLLKYHMVRSKSPYYFQKTKE